MPTSKVSICIACHNQGHLVSEAVISCLKQTYKNIEIIILDDAGTDNLKVSWIFVCPEIKYYRSDTASGTGGAFNKAISYATGEIIFLLCADDIIADNHVIEDVVKVFDRWARIGHISRWYHQFVDGDRRPVRAWRGDDVTELANNPSGLAFRASALHGCELSNKMFVEASTLVNGVMRNGWYSHILRYDTVAVRIHQSISQNKGYYLKMWKSSPVEEWAKVGGESLLKDYTSLIQIKNNFKLSAVWQEVKNFATLRPANLLSPGFWFFALVAIMTPRIILRQIPDLYRRTFGRWTTRAVQRA